MGRKKSTGAGMGYGPKGTKVMEVRSIIESPTPLNYSLPGTKTLMHKSFGVSRDRCVSVLPNH